METEIHYLPTQYSPIKTIGDKQYPLLEIYSRPETDVTIYERRYVFLTDYSETYEARWSLKREFGVLNPNPTYGGTERKLNMAFTLGARNVAESKDNLAYCARVARKIYLNYVDVGGYPQGTNPDEIFINFANWLQDTRGYLTKFNFEVDFEAGFFTYDGTIIDNWPANETPTQLGAGSHVQLAPRGSAQDNRWARDSDGPDSWISEQGYVFHGQQGKVYPRAVKVTMEMIMRESDLGFGGRTRGGTQVSKGWSLNDNRDWPHGTGPIPAAKYCQSTRTPSTMTRTFDLTGGGETEFVDENDTPLIPFGE
jgi:hypothetical protein